MGKSDRFVPLGPLNAWHGVERIKKNGKSGRVYNQPDKPECAGHKEPFSSCFHPLSSFVFPSRKTYLRCLRFRKCEHREHLAHHELVFVSDALLGSYSFGLLPINSLAPRIMAIMDPSYDLYGLGLGGPGHLFSQHHSGAPGGITNSGALSTTLLKNTMIRGSRALQRPCSTPTDASDGAFTRSASRKSCSAVICWGLALLLRTWALVFHPLSLSAKGCKDALLKKRSKRTRMLGEFEPDINRCLILILSCSFSIYINLVSESILGLSHKGSE